MVVYGSTIDVQIQSGNTEEIVVETDDATAVRVTIAGSAQPYDVDVLTSGNYPAKSDYDVNNYTSSLTAVQTFEDTNTHRVGTDVVEQSVTVQITNNSGQTATFTGAVDTHTPTDHEGVGAFLTKPAPGQSQERALEVVDGRLVGKAQSIDIGGAGPVSGTVATALAQGQILADNGDLYTDINSAVSDAEEMVVAGPGVHETGGSPVQPGTSDFYIYGYGDRTIIDGGADHAIEVTSSSDFVHIYNTQLRNDDTGHSNSVLRAEGKHLDLRNIFIYETAHNGLFINGNDWHMDHIEVSDFKASIGNHAIFIPASGLGGLGTNIEAAGAGSISLYLAGLDRVQLTNVMARNAGNQGLLVAGNDCTITNATIFGNGGAGYDDDGTNNRATGRTGNNTGANVDTAGATNPDVTDLLDAAFV